MPRFWIWRRRRPGKPGIRTIRHKYAPWGTSEESKDRAYIIAMGCLVVASSILSSRRAREELKKAGLEARKVGFELTAELRKSARSAGMSGDRREASSR